MDQTSGDANDAPNSSHNVALGANALGGNWVDAQSSDYNVAIGNNANHVLNSGYNNISIGYEAAVAGGVPIISTLKIIVLVLPVCILSPLTSSIIFKLFTSLISSLVTK